MPTNLAIIFLTFNEEQNLPKALASVKALNSPIYIIDSFSTDKTEQIAKEYNCIFVQNKFTTHTLQWKFALEQIPTNVEWVLGLDADQELLPELCDEIANTLSSEESNNYSGYYLCRRNYFLGKWIKYGGYYPRYLLKLFRKDKVYLDESELMDHHFYVNGKTTKLKNDLIENNLKEDLNFWKNKHIKYAELQAKEEFENLLQNNGSLFGNQDERRLFFKYLWNKMPLFVRPLIYFLYRYIFLLGFLDGATGSKFHYLQAYWYRNTVDQNIYNLKAQRNKNYEATYFLVKLVLLSTLFYYFNLFYIAITNDAGSLYSSTLEHYFNYIKWLREALIYFASLLINLFGYETINLPYHIKIINGVRVGVGYSCLGYGLFSVWSALILSYPFKKVKKWKYILGGFISIFILNIFRIALVGVAYTKYGNLNIDHHLIFNIITYLLIFLMIRYLINKEK
jgi:exosortase/archaeosortase family protein